MRSMFVVAVACLFVGGICNADSAQTSVKRFTNIPAQPLAAALQSLARERNYQVLYRTEVVGETATAGAVGELTVDEALTRLLSGTGLAFEYMDEKTVRIVRIGHQANAGSRGRAEELGTRLAQAIPARGSSFADQESSDNASSKDRIQEVIVTAQKRAERAFDVPISIVAMSGEELQQRQIESIDDLAMAVPGLSIQSSGLQRRIVLRGISNVFGANSPLIGMYLDEASMTSASYVVMQPDIRTYDLERVEVLRGPQGTLYGQGSMGGTIRFITRNPALDRFGLNADMAALFTQDGAPSQRIQGALNVPLVENKLGLRIAGVFDHQGGWIDQPAAAREDFNSQNLTNVRAKVLWQPTEELAVNFMAIAHRNTTAPSQAEDENGNYTQVFHLTTTPHTQDDYDMSNLTLAYDFGPARLLSTSTYIEQARDTREFAFQYQLVSPPPAPPYSDYGPQLLYGTHTFSQELRLSSPGSGPWNWTMGTLYQRGTYFIDLPVDHFGQEGPPGTALPPAVGFRVDSESKSWAVFGDTSYQLGARFTVGAGLRYYEDDQNYIGGVIGFSPPSEAGKFHALNPRVYLQYKASDSVNLYTSAAKGFRSGGFNSVVNGVRPPNYGPESVWTYELGTKMALANGRVAVEADVFYSDYTDYQTFGVPGGGLFGYTSNAGNAKLKGVEWAVTWRVGDQWTLSFDGNYIDTKFYKINATSTGHAVGDPLDMVPEYGLSVAAQKDFSWGERGGFARMDYGQQGRSEYRCRSCGPWYFSYSDVINMLNFNMSVQWTDSLSLSLFGQNLLNDRGYIDPFSADFDATRSRPRTVGIGFGVTF